MSESAVALLLRLLDESYEKSAWQGPNLRGSLRGVRAAQAAWRPAPGRHNVWELVVHCAYWKYAARRRLTGEKRGAFAAKGSNFFVRPEGGAAAATRGARLSAATERAWREDLAILDATHRRLRDAVAGLRDSDLAQRPAGSRRRTDTLVYGVASHDVYHTGQIQVLKRLWRDRTRGRS
jgi:uncharacterized damage-inducible protein DinB